MCIIFQKCAKLYKVLWHCCRLKDASSPMSGAGWPGSLQGKYLYCIHFVNPWPLLYGLTRGWSRTRSSNYEGPNRHPLKISERIKYRMFTVILSIIVILQLGREENFSKVAKTWKSLWKVVVHCSFRPNPTQRTLPSTL